ncbi:M-phase phosphoprotein 6 [Trichogramma pretiosum]|nr:M-phase phosphoprotein 6 [Trichogramma pretiosum]
MALMRDKNAKLSKSILEMKFMKRTKEKVEQQTYQKEGEDFFASNAAKLAKSKGEFITANSYVQCEDLIEGRLSFQGENPELERMLELEELAKRAPKEEPVDQKDVTDEQMARLYQQATTKINVKTTTIRKIEQSTPDRSKEPRRKRAKFIKPKEDDF